MKFSYSVVRTEIEFGTVEASSEDEAELMVLDGHHSLEITGTTDYPSSGLELKAEP